MTSAQQTRNPVRNQPMEADLTGAPVAPAARQPFGLIMGTPQQPSEVPTPVPPMEVPPMQPPSQPETPIGDPPVTTPPLGDPGTGQ